MCFSRLYTKIQWFFDSTEFDNIMFILVAALCTVKFLVKFVTLKYRVIIARKALIIFTIL